MQPTFRIASICPSNTELACALGLAPCLVGVDNYSDYPEAVVATLPKLGPDLHIDIEMLRSLAPDLVISSLSVPGMERVVEAVEGAGLNQVVLAPNRLSDIVSDAMRIVEVLPAHLQREVRLDALVQSFEARLARVAQATAQVQHRPRLYWEWWPNPVFSPGGDNWLTEVSQLAGGQNIFADVPGAQVRDEGPRVFAEDPDVMLAIWTGVPQHKVPLAKIKARSGGWTSTAAYTHKRLYILSEGLYCRPSPRLLDGLEQLFGLLHPNLASAIGLAAPHTYAPVRAWDGHWLSDDGTSAGVFR